MSRSAISAFRTLDRTTAFRDLRRCISRHKSILHSHYIPRPFLHNPRLTRHTQAPNGAAHYLWRHRVFFTRRTISSSSQELHEQISATTVKLPDTKHCWKCNTEIPYLGVQCNKDDCGAVQNIPPKVSYFEILGVGAGDNKSQPTFDISISELRASFLRTQQLVHPDNHTQSAQPELSFAQRQSSFVNKAYNTLLKPLSRAHYILALEGIEVTEAESLDDQDLLMEVLEAREELENAAGEDEVQKIKSQNDERIKQTVQLLSKAFDRKDLNTAKNLTIQLQYWENLRQAIVDWEPGKRIEVHH